MISTTRRWRAAIRCWSEASDGRQRESHPHLRPGAGQPPFSLKSWGHDVWSKGDAYGRDRYGCPPKSYGDLAFVQHMVASLKEDGVCGVVLPHGVLFRGGAEGKIREGLIRDDLIEAVIGLAPNLFYGAGIPACILILRKQKPAAHKGKILIVNGAEQFVEGKAQNHLSEANVATLAKAYGDFADTSGWRGWCRQARSRRMISTSISAAMCTWAKRTRWSMSQPKWKSWSSFRWSAMRRKRG